ncbi:MAG: ATP-binding cassette domain-containing protein [Acidimicrobiia bacterium]|nr:ATP-binding cassette domain-containing protein [Acidimicrobiia bacterium]
MLEVNDLRFRFAGGQQLFDDVSFRVGDGEHVALVGANGTGKTTLVRLLAGDEVGATGTIRVDGRLGVMRQFIGSVRDETTVRQLLTSLAWPRRGAGGAMRVATTSRCCGTSARWPRCASRSATPATDGPASCRAVSRSASPSRRLCGATTTCSSSTSPTTTSTCQARSGSKRRSWPARRRSCS